jgi:biopolymer transport protein TolR
MSDLSAKPKTASFGTGTGTYSHQDFTYVRKKRGKLVPDNEEQHGELNIVPYLDIVINLIMFLLVAQATLVSLGVINVTAPSYSTNGPGPTDGSEQNKKLRLTIGVADRGFYIAATGGVLPGEQPVDPNAPPPSGPVEPTIPKKPDGSYDFPALSRKLRAIKTAFPESNEVFVAAEDTTLYEVLVKTLDASREDAQGELFPNVAFTQVN